MDGQPVDIHQPASRLGVYFNYLVPMYEDKQTKEEEEQRGASLSELGCLATQCRLSTVCVNPPVALGGR